MSLYEYRLRMEANVLKQVDREYELHLQAWLIREVKAEKMVGKSKAEAVYKRFDSFFDYNSRIAQVLKVGGGRAQDSRIRKVARRLEKLRGEVVDGKL